MPDQLTPADERTLRPEDVPSDLYRLAIDAVMAIEDDGAFAVTAQQEVAVALAAMLPEHARQVREKAAAEIRALADQFGSAKSLAMGAEAETLRWAADRIARPEGT